MSYTILEEKIYTVPGDTVFAAAQAAMVGLNGKLLKQEASSRTLEVQFDKTIHGKVVGDRTRFTIQVKEKMAGETAVSIEAYPLDAVGRKLIFGAREGVTRTVLDWYWAHLEHQVKQAVGSGQ